MAVVLNLPKVSVDEEVDILKGEIFLAEFWLTREQDRLRDLLMEQVESRRIVRKHKATLTQLQQRLEEIEKDRLTTQPAEKTP